MKMYILLCQVLITLTIITYTHSTTCYNALTPDTESWYVGDETTYYLPYACGLKKTNAQVGSTINLVVDATNCPSACSGFNYGCGEVAAQQISGHGYYECTMKPSNAPGTITTCMVASSTRAPYEEIHIKFIGNDTAHISIGYFTNGLYYQAGPIALKFLADLDYHNYGFEWQSNYIKWFVDGIEVSSEMGSRPIPLSPNRMQLSFLVEQPGITTDDSAIYTDPSVDRTFSSLGAPYQSSFKNISYIPSIPESCDGTGITPGHTNWTGYDPEACTTRHVAIIYDDQLQSGWSDSGSSTHNLVANSFIHSGTAAISWDVLPSAVLYFKTSGVISQSDYYGFEFWVYGNGKTGQQITVTLLLPGGATSSPLNLNEVLTSGIQPYSWSRVVLPFSSFGLTAAASIVGFVLTSLGQDFGGTIYIDDVILDQQYPFCINRTMVIFDDSLSSSFLNGQWGDGHSIVSTPVHSGSAAISWIIYNNNGIKFHATTPVDTNIWQGVALYINYQQLRGWQISMSVTINDQAVGTVGLLDYYGGSFPPGDWVKVVIPFSEFGVLAGTPVDGFIMQGTTDSYQGTMFLDDISFVSTYAPGQAPSAATSLSSSFALVLAAMLVLCLL